MTVYQVTTDASNQYRQSASAPTAAFTPTAVQGNLSHTLGAGAILGTQVHFVGPATEMPPVEMQFWSL